MQLLVQLIFTMKKVNDPLIKKILNKTSEHGFGVRVPTRPPKNYKKNKYNIQESEIYGKRLIEDN